MIQTFKDILSGLADCARHIFSTNGILYKAIVAVVMFFSGLHTFIICISGMVIMDVFTGLVASRKDSEAFSSRKLRKGLLEKLALYMILLISVFFVDTLFVHDFGFTRLFFSFFITFLITIYEATSIIENLYRIRPDIPFLNGLVGIFRKLGDKAMVSMESRSDDIVNTVTNIQNITMATTGVTATTVSSVVVSGGTGNSITE